MAKLPKIQFSASLFVHANKNTLLIRKELNDNKTMRYIFGEIIKKGKFEFHGEIIFVNRLKSILKLKERNLY